MPVGKNDYQRYDILQEPYPSGLKAALYRLKQKKKIFFLSPNSTLWLPAKQPPISPIRIFCFSRIQHLTGRNLCAIGGQ